MCVCMYAIIYASVLLCIQKSRNRRDHVSVHRHACVFTRLTQACVLHSIRIEASGVCIPSSATCFTSGQKSGACFHTETGSFKCTVRGCLFVSAHVCRCLGQGENDREWKQTAWLRCPQSQPIGSPKIHHSCPPANRGLPCGAGISLEDCYLAKCSQANDGQDPGDGSEMWSLTAENFVEPLSISGKQEISPGPLSLNGNAHLTARSS